MLPKSHSGQAFPGTARRAKGKVASAPSRLHAGLWNVPELPRQCDTACTVPAGETAPYRAVSTALHPTHTTAGGAI